MQGKIVVLDQPEGPLGDLAGRLNQSGFAVAVRHTAEEALETVKQQEAQLLIALGIIGSSGATLADTLYDAVNVPIMLVLSTAGEETMTFLRRHPGVIGVYYVPLNVDKFLERVNRFFKV